MTRLAMQRRAIINQVFSFVDRCTQSDDAKLIYEKYENMLKMLSE